MTPEPNGPRLSKPLRAFFEKLEFRRLTSPMDEDVLSVRIQGGGHEYMAAGGRNGILRGMSPVLRYGIGGWMNASFDDLVVERPEDDPAVDMPDPDLMQAYLDAGNPEPAEYEWRDFQKQLHTAAIGSEIVRGWTADNLDFEALHAFDGVFRSAPRIERGYNLIAGIPHMARGLRRFVIEWPLLAGLVVEYRAIRAILDGIRIEKPSDAYDAVVRHVVEYGIGVPPEGTTPRTVGPVPKAVLDHISFMKVGRTGKFDEDYVRMASHALELARRLPPECVPRHDGEFTGLAAAGQVIRYFEQPRGPLRSVIDDGIGLGMNFTETDLAAIFADAPEDGWARFAQPGGSFWVSEAAGRIARYGATLDPDGRDWVVDHVAGRRPEKVPESISSFAFADALKAVMIRDGFIETLATAEALDRHFRGLPEPDRPPGFGVR